MKRAISGLMIVMSLLALLVGSVYFFNHQVPAEAPFLTSTICTSIGATPDHLVQLVGSPQYNLLVGTFRWEREVRPKFGYVIFDKQGQVTNWDESLLLVRGQDYEVCRTDIHGNAAYPTPVAYINAI